MSDNSSCYFNRHKSKLLIYPEGSDHPDAGKSVFLLELSSEDWDVLSNSEFSSRLTKARLLGTSFVQIEGSQSHEFLRFLSYILPLIKSICPIRLCVDGCRTAFIDKLSQNTDGFCLDIRLPLKNQYIRSDRDICRTSGEYRSPMQYREDVITAANLIDHLPLSMFRVSKRFMTDQDLRDTVSFLSGFKSPVVIDR